MAITEFLIALLAIFGDQGFAMTIAQKGVDVLFGNEENAAALTAVSTVRAAFWHILLLEEGKGAIATVSAPDFYYNAINQHNFSFSSGVKM
jgi:hypothetical protein